MATTEPSICGLEVKDAAIYWCCQSLCKYQPQDDVVFPSIAVEVPNCRFVFVQSKREGLNRLFCGRLERAFAAHGLDWRTHVVMLPSPSFPDFEVVTRLPDMFLDSIGWSGCNTTLECIAAGLSVVTLPGTSMRSRHSTAIPRMMGGADTIAATRDEYLSIAVRLGLSDAYRARAGQWIRGNYGKLCLDRASVEGRAQFLSSLPTRAAPS